MLAHDIIKVFDTGKGNELFLYDKHNCDLMHTHIPTKRIFIDSPTPDILINCSGYNAVDKAETDQDTCYMINSGAVDRLVSVCSKYGTKFIHFSSDYIFDGKKNKPYTEEDEPSSLGIYGKSKAHGEHAVSKANKGFTVRTAWLFGKNGRNFVEIILKKLDAGKKFNVVSDQIGCPTSTVDLAKIVKQLVDIEYSGIINVVNDNGNVSWYDFAVEIAKIAGYDKNLIGQCNSDEYQASAKRPKYSVLSTQKLNLELEINMRSWQEALKEYLDN